MFLPHFDVLCDLLLDRCTATWNLFVLYNKELNFFHIKAALFHVRRATEWGLPVEWKLTGKQELNCKSTILKENGGKVESVFVIRSAQWAERLGCCLDYCRGWKLRSENLRLRSTWRPFDSSFEREGALVTVEICVLCGRWFSNKFEIVSETPFSCDTVGRELLWAVLCSLLCRETNWNIRIGKQGYVFIL